MSIEADSGPDYSGALWTGECSGGGFGWDLFGGFSLLSLSALVLCSMVEVIIVQCSILMDNVF